MRALFAALRAARNAAPQFFLSAASRAFEIAVSNASLGESSSSSLAGSFGFVAGFVVGLVSVFVFVSGLVSAFVPAMATCHCYAASARS